MKRPPRMIGRESGYGLTESMDWHDPATASYTTAVTTMLDAAVDFGLTPDEARRTLHEAMADPRREASVAAYLDRIAGALARTILAKQRRLRGSFDI